MEAKQLLDAMGADYSEVEALIFHRFPPIFGRSQGVPGLGMVPGLAAAGGEARGAGTPLWAGPKQHGMANQP